MTAFTKSQLFERYPVLMTCEGPMTDALNALKKSFEQGGKLLVLGNGGSSADAEHFCGELVKGFILKRELKGKHKDLYDQIDADLAAHIQYGLPAISLGVSHSFISAFSNDLSWDYAYAQQIHVLAEPKDVIFAITTSGNSKNIIHALKVAKAKGVRSISLTGQNESQCSSLSDICIRVPRTITHEAQELHLPVYHALAIELEDYFYAN